MDGTLDLTIRGGPINLNNITQTQSVIVKLKKKILSTHVKRHGQFLHLQCHRSKLGKFRTMPYSEIIVKGQNPKFLKKLQCLISSMMNF